MFAAALLLLAGCKYVAQQETSAINKKPNVVIIFTDDQGYADLGAFGGMHVNTPRIDQMAREGSKLTSFYVAAPVCTPSRAALMTGSYPRRIDMAYGSTFGVLLAADSKGLHPDEVTIAEVLKKAGYKTAIFGKWHLGDQPEFLPTRQGFDEFFGIPYSHDMHTFARAQEKYNYPPLPLLEGEQVIEAEPDADYLTQRITERAVRFIEENRDNPFFLYVPHPIPHRPLHVSPPFMAGVSPEILDKLAKEDGNIDYPTRDGLFRQAIDEIDWSVGQILDAIEEQGLDDNTLVIFTSDNGPAIGEASPLRGRKGSTFEGGMREPTVVRWPGQIPAGLANDELMTTMDLLPTLAKLAGGEVPADRVIDGRDIWGVLTGKDSSPHEAFFYYRLNTLQAVRSGKWKLHLYHGKKRLDQPVLHDLDADIGETEDLAAQHPGVVERLLAYIETAREEMGDGETPGTQGRAAGFVASPQYLTRHNAPQEINQ
jgi:arylsulfatase A-like enzyme